VKVPYGSLTLNANLNIADGKTLSNGVVLMLHGTLAHKDMEIMRALQDLLSDYVDAHFAREEEAMRRVSYPDLESHLVSHHELTATVHEYAKLNPTNPCGISRKEVLKFFGNWLFGHILGSDMAYVPYISRGKW